MSLIWRVPPVRIFGPGIDETQQLFLKDYNYARFKSHYEAT